MGRGTPDRTVDEAFGTPDMAAATGDILTDAEHAGLNHAGLAGVLGEAGHAAVDHDGLPGVYTVPDAPAAYTQTYTATSRTHPDLTSQVLTDNMGATPDTTLADIPSPQIVAGVGALNVSDTNVSLNNFRVVVENNIADVAAQINALRADVVALKKVLNAVIDDLQTEGVVG